MNTNELIKARTGVPSLQYKIYNLSNNILNKIHEKNFKIYVIDIFEIIHKVKLINS